MILNSRSVGKDYLVTVIDDELINKELEHEGNIIRLSESFYAGKRASKKEIINELRKATIINVFGKESVKTAQQAGVIDDVLMIAGVPHAQMIMV